MTVHVVGFGLAGAWCCYWLREAGCNVVVHSIDNPNTCSRIAAGMITPITGQRVKPTWKFTELWPGVCKLYDNRFVRHRSLRRVFTSQQMADWFAQRMGNGEYRGINVNEIPVGYYEGIEYPFGGFETSDCATVNIPGWLDHIRMSCVDEYVDGPFDSSSVPSDEAVVYAMGFDTKSVDAWSWVPLEPSKGEILDVVGTDLPTDYVLSNGTWILPGIDFHRVGATNVWDEVDVSPTDEAKRKLLADVRHLTHHTPRVIAHRAAIRPSTQYKRPIVGAHPTAPRLYVCTGFGAKGTLYGPWAAQQLVDHIVTRSPVDTTIDCLSFWKSDV